MHDVGALLLEHDVDAGQQAVTDGADGDAGVLMLAAFTGIEGLELWVMLAGDLGCHPHRSAQIDGAALGEVGVRGVELTALVAGIGDQLAEAGEAMDIADLTRDGGSQDGAQARDGGQVSVGLGEQVR